MSLIHFLPTQHYGSHAYTTATYWQYVMLLAAQSLTISIFVALQWCSFDPGPWRRVLVFRWWVWKEKLKKKEWKRHWVIMGFTMQSQLLYLSADALIYYSCCHFSVRYCKKRWVFVQVCLFTYRSVHILMHTHNHTLQCLSLWVDFQRQLQNHWMWDERWETLACRWSDSTLILYTFSYSDWSVSHSLSHTLWPPSFHSLLIQGKVRKAL